MMCVCILYVDSKPRRTKHVNNIFDPKNKKGIRETIKTRCIYLWVNDAGFVNRGIFSHFYVIILNGFHIYALWQFLNQLICLLQKSIIYYYINVRQLMFF